MDFNKLYEEMIQHKNEEQAQKMSKYMLNKFEYIRIKTPEKRKKFKNFFLRDFQPLIGGLWCGIFGFDSEIFAGPA